ncbi:Uu.00g037520.m01.CDS01 [Anthostomella pinea]|uniref:Uu.00g037520.m01.CDS01 n=1 Tax=Anthostomella pinea TaxID=933095 RepID=A0AAI8V9M0_9PEZI|nr:Uu.00g037520.m01.CDS01 [Anthostomella pinea]
MATKPAQINYGQRLLPVVIDELARDEPQRPWASLPLDDNDLTQGYEDISYAAFANAINKLSWLVEATIGRSTSFATIAYMGPSDVRYQMMQMAACKTGHKVLFSSHLNSLHIHVSLMEQTRCQALLTASGVDVDDILEGRPMLHALIPELDDLLCMDDIADHYPYTKTFAQAAQDPYLVLHSSGTTGDSKPVVINHAAVATVERQNLLPDVEGWTHFLLSKLGKGVRFLVPSAPFHALCSMGSLCSSVFGGAVFVPGLRHRAVEPSEICDVLTHCGATKAVLVPWMMEEVARRPDARDYIESLEVVCFGGAALSPSASRIWAQHTKIQNFWAGTEFLSPPQLEADPGDHAYVFFDVERGGLEFRAVQVDSYSSTSSSSSTETLYEMVITLTPKSALFSPWHARNGITLDSNSTPSASEIAVGDLWTPHPDPKKARYAWRFAGRLDDLITFSTAINLRPAPMESALAAHESVGAALVIGNRRQQPLALIELAPGVSPEAISEIWKAVIRPLNARVPAHGRVAETHVLPVAAGEFVRTPKGSVARGETEKKFEGEIEVVYARFGDRWQDGSERYVASGRRLARSFL